MAGVDFVVFTLLTVALLYSGWKLGTAINAWLDEEDDPKKSGPGAHPPGS